LTEIRLGDTKGEKAKEEEIQQTGCEAVEHGVQLEWAALNASPWSIRRLMKLLEVSRDPSDVSYAEDPSPMLMD
jgi:hypothetical protein